MKKTKKIYYNYAKFITKKEKILNEILYEKLFYLSQQFYEIPQELFTISNLFFPNVTHFPAKKINSAISSYAMMKKNRQGIKKPIFLNSNFGQATLDIVKKFNPQGNHSYETMIKPFTNGSVLPCFSPQNLKGRIATLYIKKDNIFLYKAQGQRQKGKKKKKSQSLEMLVVLLLNKKGAF